jgi:hypothetical protein
MKGGYTDSHSPFLQFASSAETFDSLLMSHVQTDYVREK